MKRSLPSHLNTTNLAIIRCLYLSDFPVPLREIAYRTNLQIRTVQLILEKFLKEKIVRKKRKGQRTSYTINKEDPYIILLNEFIEKQNMMELNLASQEYSERATNALPNIVKMYELVTRGKRDYESR